MGSSRKATQFTAMHNALFEKKRELVTLTKVTTTEDVMGNTTTETETSDSDVSMIIQPILESDRHLVGKGVDIEGYMKCYCDPSYDLTNNGSDTTIEVGDKITRSGAYNSTVWRVEEIIGKQAFYGTEIYRKLLLRRI